MNHDELETLLISKPKEILDRELAIIELTTSHAEDRRIADEIKTLAKNEAAMNLNFKNEGQRNASVETALRDNVIYQEKTTKIPLTEKDIKIAQVNLAFQKDLLRSYLAIAGMK